MNFREVFGKDFSWKNVVEGLGYEEVKLCIPFEYCILKEAYYKDKNLNNLPLKTWAQAAGFLIYNSASEPVFCKSRLTDLYYPKLKVSTFGCSDGVCILKECARTWIEEGEAKIFSLSEEKYEGCKLAEYCDLQELRLCKNEKISGMSISEYLRLAKEVTCEEIFKKRKISDGSNYKKILFEVICDKENLS